MKNKQIIHMNFNEKLSVSGTFEEILIFLDNQNSDAIKYLQNSKITFSSSEPIEEQILNCLNERLKNGKK